MPGSTLDNDRGTTVATGSASASVGAFGGAVGYTLISYFLNSGSLVGMLVTTGVSAGAALSLTLAYYATVDCAVHKDVDIENPRPQENTNLLPAQENKETCLGQFGRCWTGLFANCLKPEVESANNLDGKVHQVHQI